MADFSTDILNNTILKSLDERVRDLKNFVQNNFINDLLSTSKRIRTEENLQDLLETYYISTEKIKPAPISSVQAQSKLYEVTPAPEIEQPIQELKQKKEEEEEKLAPGNIDYVPPGAVTPIITGRYGEQRSTGAHGGTDLAVTEGTPLRAVSDGEIVDGGQNPGGWGNFIVYRDNKGIYHLYGHIQNGYRGRGSVKKGDIVAKVGMTGRVTGPHLHWETGTGWTGGVLTGKFDPLNRYSMNAPFSTARDEVRPQPANRTTVPPSPPQKISSTNAGGQILALVGTDPAPRSKEVKSYRPNNSLNKNYDNPLHLLITHTTFNV